MHTIRKTTARNVRTGDVITTDYARPRTLTVDYPNWERFTSPEGWTCDVIRFTGTDEWDQHIDKAFGLRADDRVYIVKDAPINGQTFNALTEWVDVHGGQIAWDEWQQDNS